MQSNACIYVESRYFLVLEVGHATISSDSNAKVKVLGNKLVTSMGET